MGAKKSMRRLRKKLEPFLPPSEYLLVKDDQGNNHSNPDVKFEHYVALAWVGLDQTKVYKSLSSIERQRIEANRRYFLT